jgi:hypothetical protein
MRYSFVGKTADSMITEKLVQCYCDFVPIISVHLGHEHLCGKPQKLALLAQLTSTPASYSFL